MHDVAIFDNIGLSFGPHLACLFGRLFATKCHEIIKSENPDNTQLFAYAYNALGTCHLQNKNLKEARTAFLHTELLFSKESEAMAEALYNLSLIWPDLGNNDRAIKARESLKNSFRNSYWARKL